MPAVLIVDDDRIFRKILRLIFEEIGYDVIVADSKEEALAAAQQSKIDIVFSDLRLKGDSGFEVISALKALPGKATVPVVLMSGSRRLETSSVCGVDGFLVKPFGIDTLLDLLLRFGTTQ